MLNMEKIKAMKKIKEEYKEINSNPIANIGVSVGLPNEDNIFEWQATLMGPKDTSYANGLFYLRIKFPVDYPQSAPEVCFKTPIYHVNINPHKSSLTGPGSEGLGHVCISTLNWWKPEYTMREVLTNIFALFYMGNPDGCFNPNMAKEYRNNRDLYEKKVAYFTKKYALHNQNHDWNFNY